MTSVVGSPTLKLKTAFKMERAVAATLADLEPRESGIISDVGGERAFRRRLMELGLVPGTRVAVIERCSGHGGIWGARTENFDIAVKVGKPAAQAALKNDTSYVASECPLAAEHLLQVMEMTAGDAPPKPKRADHPKIGRAHV